MGFCSEEEYREFLWAAPVFEKMLIRAGIILSKYWFSVNGEEQERRFEKRMSNEMFEQTDTKNSPWYVVNADTKKRARLNCIAHLLSQIPYHDMRPVQVPWPPRPSILYKRPKMSTQSFIPEIYQRSAGARTDESVRYSAHCVVSPAYSCNHSTAILVPC